MNRGKRIVFLLIILAVLVFSIFFKNRLVTRAAERGLEAVFGAQADILGLRFQPLRGRVALEALAVTDADAAERNLFELGSTVIDLNLNQLLRRRLVLEEVACRGLRFGAERMSPGRVSETAGGAQPGAETRVQERGQAAGVLLLSARELVASRYESLESTVRLQELAEILDSSVNVWEERRRGLEAELLAASAAGEEVLAIKVEELRSPEEAVRALQTVDRARRLLEDSAETLRQAGADSVREKRRIEEAFSAASASLAADREALLRLWAAPAKEMKGIAAVLLESLLEPRLGKAARYAVRAVEAASELRGGRQSRGARRGRGREVAFSGSPYPGFLIRRLEGSLEEEDRLVRATLTDLSSDMELWGRPARAEAAWRSGRNDLGLTGVLDLRILAEKTLVLTLASRSESTRLDLENWPPLTGRHEFESTFAVDRQAGVEGILSIRADMQAEQAEAGAPLGRIVERGFAQLTEVIVGGTYTAAPGGEIRLKLESNLKELLDRALEAELEELGKELERELAAVVKTAEEENSRRLSELSGEWQRLDDGRTAVAELEKALKKQGESINNRLLRLGGGALPEALKQLKLPGN
jgi:uncharacterized protein (TIGR03545 family)